MCTFNISANIFKTTVCVMTRTEQKNCKIYQVADKHIKLKTFKIRNNCLEHMF